MERGTHLSALPWAAWVYMLLKQQYPHSPYGKRKKENLMKSKTPIMQAIEMAGSITLKDLFELLRGMEYTTDSGDLKLIDSLLEDGTLEFVDRGGVRWYRLYKEPVVVSRDDVLGMARSIGKDFTIASLGKMMGVDVAGVVQELERDGLIENHRNGKYMGRTFPWFKVKDGAPESGARRKKVKKT